MTSIDGSWKNFRRTTQPYGSSSRTSRKCQKVEKSMKNLDAGNAPPKKLQKFIQADAVIERIVSNFCEAVKVADFLRGVARNHTRKKYTKIIKKSKISKRLLSKPEFNVDFKSVLIFATLFILFEILAFECTKVSQKILRTAILDFSVCLPFQNMTLCSSFVAKFSINEQIYKSSQVDKRLDYANNN